MHHFLIGALSVAAICCAGCSKKSGTANPPRAAAASMSSAPADFVGKITYYEVSAPEGKLRLKAKKLTLIFEGINIGEDGKGVTSLSNFQHPDQGSATTDNTHHFGSSKVEVKQASRYDGAIGVDVNGYKFR